MFARTTASQRGSDQHLSATVAALLTGIILSVPAGAKMPAPDVDGWHQWRVAAHHEAPDWCCYSWSGDSVSEKGCNLDDNERKFGAVSGQRAFGDSPHPGTMKIYARMRDGEPVEVRTVSASCPVRSSTPVSELGLIDASDSVAWLKAQIRDNAALSSDALAAIAVHSGKEARQVLVATAQRDALLANRKHAVFWMGQVRGKDTGDEIKTLMLRDSSKAMRIHAAFSLSQSDASGKTRALTRLATSDDDADVRGKAWFWLSQAGEPDSDAAMLAALESEKDRGVLDALIFAMSQLPGDTAANTLIALIENRQQPDSLRKRALFWIAQNDSPRAGQYLDDVFAR